MKRRALSVHQEKWQCRLSHCWSHWWDYVCFVHLYLYTSIYYSMKIPLSLASFTPDISHYWILIDAVDPCVCVFMLRPGGLIPWNIVSKIKFNKPSRNQIGTPLSFCFSILWYTLLSLTKSGVFTVLPRLPLSSNMEWCFVLQISNQIFYLLNPPPKHTRRK